MLHNSFYHGGSPVEPMRVYLVIMYSKLEAIICLLKYKAYL